MASVFLGVIFVAVCYGISLVSQIWPVILALVIIGVTCYAAYFVMQYSRFNKVIRARKVGREEPIIKRVKQKTGYSIGADWEYYDHYEERDVVTGYTVKFEVMYIDGTKDVITCEKDGLLYNKLMTKSFRARKQLQY